MMAVALGPRFIGLASRERRRRGTILIWVAIFLGIVLAFIGLALDTGYVLLTAHQLQNTADAAALAGVQRVRDDQEAARLLAHDIGIANKAGGVFVDLDLNAGNASDGDIVLGTYDRNLKEFTPDTGAPNAVKVTARRTDASLNGSLPLIFAPAYGVATSQVARSAIAMIASSTGGPGIILLDPSGEKALEHSGNGTIIVEGPIYINSSDPSALYQSGNGTLEADSYEVVGDYYQSGDGEITGEMNTGTDPVADPFASLPVPNLPDYPIRSTSNYSPASGTTLQPGRYQGGINFSGSSFTLEPGVYIMEGGGFKISSSMVFTANEVMVYNAGTNGGTSNADQVLISGDAQVNWSPPSSGIYAGFGIFQHRDISDKKIQISGNGSMNMTGIVYAASGEVQLSGNGTTDVIGGGFVANSIQISGDGTFSVGVGSNWAGAGSGVFLVE